MAAALDGLSGSVWFSKIRIERKHNAMYIDCARDRHMPTDLDPHQPTVVAASYAQAAWPAERSTRTLPSPVSSPVCLRFFTLTQYLDRPALIGPVAAFDTKPSRPIRCSDSPSQFSYQEKIMRV